MPAYYTHYRFGADCLEVMPEPLRALASGRRELYEIGLHGPDVLFYHSAPIPGRVSALGSALHRGSGADFFARARLVWNTRPERDAMAAYLLGFLCHFLLDSACHARVNAAAAEHNRVEAVWDAAIMRREGLRPSRVLRGAEIVPSELNARITAPFFGLDGRTMLRCLRGQVRTLRLLYSPRGVKKRLLRGAIRALRIPGGFDGLFIDDAMPPALEGDIAALDALCAGARAEYPAMAEALFAYLAGDGELPERFGRTFD